VAELHLILEHSQLEVAAAQRKQVEMDLQLNVEQVVMG
jgi:hypothetical protein